MAEIHSKQVPQHSMWIFRSSAMSKSCQHAPVLNSNACISGVRPLDYMMTVTGTLWPAK